MVPSPNGKGVIVIGRFNDDEDNEICAAMELDGDTLEWKILNIEIESSGMHFKAIPISYEFDVNCI